MLFFVGHSAFGDQHSGGSIRNAEMLAKKILDKLAALSVILPLTDAMIEAEIDIRLPASDWSAMSRISAKSWAQWARDKMEGKL